LSEYILGSTNALHEAGIPKEDIVEITIDEGDAIFIPEGRSYQS